MKLLSPHAPGAVLVALVLVQMIAIVVAESATAVTIGFDPDSEAVALGDPIAVDLWVTNLDGEIVSSYDLDILYDPQVVNAVGVSFGLGLGDALAFEVLEDFDLGTPGLVDLAQVSFLSDAELLALQGGSEVQLGTLFFETVAPGTTALSFVFDAVNDIKGANAVVLAVTADAGSIEVAPAIPEPSAALLIGGGLIWLARRRASRLTPRIGAEWRGRRAWSARSDAPFGAGDRVVRKGSLVLGSGIRRSDPRVRAGRTPLERRAPGSVAADASASDLPGTQSDANRADRGAARGGLARRPRH